MFPLRVEADHRRLTVWVPPSIYRTRGLVTLALPAVILAAALAELAGGTLRHPSTGMIVLTLALIAVSTAAGVAQIVLARKWSRRGAAVFDRTSGLVRREAESVRLAEVAMLRIRQHAGRTAIDLVGIDGLLITVLHRGLPSAYGRDLVGVVEAINAWLREPVSVPPELGARSPRERLEE